MSLSDVLSIVGLAVSLIGIPLAYALAKRGRKRPVLRYAVDFNVVVDSSVGFLRSRLLQANDGSPVRQISRSAVALWNHQGDTISGGDVLDTDRLRIKLEKGDRVLRHRVIACSRRVNRLSVLANHDDQTELLIAFDFLDATDGGIIEIIHEGNNRPNIVGTMRGVEVSYRGFRSISLGVVIVTSGAFLTRHRLLFNWLRALAVSVIALAVGNFVVGVSTSESANGLVDVTRFDLHSPDGQRAFADAVEYGMPGSIDAWGFVNIFATVIAFMVAGGFLATTTTRMPRNIFRDSSMLDED
ncbi:hypothetical protein [Amycolatopsis vastitatis]|uniref:hypothetical protein n=1 Tax=Amycolatopsis vastitatis TaxID=1905142 RepID=UPI0011780FA3|nr:hypothetical protein [Amycolatopsis vastitatis]